MGCGGRIRHAVTPCTELRQTSHRSTSTAAMRICSIWFVTLAVACSVAEVIRPDTTLHVPLVTAAPLTWTGPLIAGIGYGHTGTTTLAEALVRLGLPKFRVEHYSAVTRHLILLNLTGGRYPRDRSVLLHGIRSHDQNVEYASKAFEWAWRVIGMKAAILDEPVNLYWRQILQRFPDTKFILTVRANVSNWMHSQFMWYPHNATHILPTRPRHHHYVKAAMKLAWSWCEQPLRIDCDKAYRTLNFGRPDPSRADLLRAYHTHNAEVKAGIPPDQLLVFDVTAGDGYEKLAKFLGVPVPRDENGNTPPMPRKCNGGCVHKHKVGDT